MLLLVGDVQDNAYAARFVVVNTCKDEYGGFHAGVVDSSSCFLLLVVLLST